MGSVQLSRRSRQWPLDLERGNFTTHRDRHDPLAVQPLVAVAPCLEKGRPPIWRISTSLRTTLAVSGVEALSLNASSRDVWRRSTARGSNTWTGIISASSSLMRVWRREGSASGHVRYMEARRKHPTGKGIVQPQPIIGSLAAQQGW